MYAIYEKVTQKQICALPVLRSPKMAWDYFRENYWDKLRTLPDGTVLDWGGGDHRTYFECRLAGERAPVLRVPGHALRIETIIGNGPATFTAHCGCGWSINRSARSEVKQEHRQHLEGLPNVDLTPRPAEHLPAVERVEKSLNRLKAEGGDRKTFRLPKPALEELDRMVNEEKHSNHTAALESLLTRRPVIQPSGGPSLYARHVDDEDVQEIVANAAKLACQELDFLFPNVAHPDAGKGITSNFQGLLEKHITAMLAGKNAARQVSHTHLPALLADDNVFGKHFSLMDERGAGYVVVSPTTNQVLSAYSGRFIPVYRGRSKLLGQWRLDPLFGDYPKECLAVGANITEYQGRELHFQNEEADILFSTYDGATQAALKALLQEEESPVSRPLKIIAAAYHGEKNCYVVTKTLSDLQN